MFQLNHFDRENLDSALIVWRLLKNRSEAFHHPEMVAICRMSQYDAVSIKVAEYNKDPENAFVLRLETKAIHFINDVTKV